MSLSISHISSIRPYFSVIPKNKVSPQEAHLVIYPLTYLSTFNSYDIQFLNKHIMGFIKQMCCKILDSNESFKGIS